MTGDCSYYGRCKCKDGYYMSGDGCKRMSIDSFIFHREFFAENQYFDINLVVIIRRGYPKFFFLLKNVIIALNQEGLVTATCMAITKGNASANMGMSN